MELGNWGKTVAVAAVISCMCLGQVGAYRLQPDQQRMLDRAKGYVERTVERNGQDYADEVYNQVTYVSDEHKNPFIRFFMLDMKGWMETKFGAGSLAWRNEGYSRSRVAGKYANVSDRGEIGAPLEMAVAPEFETQSNTDDEPDTVPIVVETEPEDDLYEQREVIKLPKTSQYYQLENGRIDITKVQLKRMEWVNNAREDRDLEPYSTNSLLNRTALQRSYTMRDKQSADHKRFANSSYYDYQQITKWFADRGVEFANINRSTYTENVGYARFDCDEGDCTEEAISSLRRVFDYFMGEEGKAYDVHYRTIVHPRYEKMGMGFVVDEDNNWIYSAQHYGTEVL